MGRSVLVLGLGNALLGDDAAGLAVLSELQRQPDPWGGTVAFLDGGTQGLALLAHLSRERALVILDAVKLGAAPGTVHVLDGWRRAAARSSTAHESSAAELLEAAALLGELPDQVAIIGIEPENIETGAGLSRAVRKALPRAVQAAESQIERIVRPTSPQPPLREGQSAE
jgi:hydrogenase maturation protease